MLVLDHINGIGDDNRLENLQLVCPNCNSQLATFAGRNIQRVKAKEIRRDAVVRVLANPKDLGPRRQRGGQPGPRPKTRRVDRPSYKQLMQEIAETNYSAVGRKYGVSDNAIRKWVKTYEATLHDGDEGTRAESLKLAG